MYDLNLPHLKVVAKGRTSLIVQNGQVWEHGSRKHIGPVMDLHKTVLGNKDTTMCKFCGGTYPDSHMLEDHFLKFHKEILITEASKFAPKNAKGKWSPDDEMLAETAKTLAQGQVDLAPVTAEKSHREKR